MWKRNSGTNEDHVTQNQFTTYLCKAVGRRKQQYMKKQWVKTAHEVNIDPSRYEDLLAEEMDLLAGLPPLAQMENQWLVAALLGLTDRERYILMARALGGRGFQDLSMELGSNYKAVSTAYYRAVKKVRARMMGGEHE